jgi:hypothetical protein
MMRAAFVTIGMVSLATALSAEPTPRAVCDHASMAESPVGRSWNSVRDALLGARTAEGSVRVALFERTVSRDGKSTRDSTQRELVVAARRPFASLPVADIAKRGYIVEDGDGVAYYAPDADILLDPSFVATHCFSEQKSTKQEPSLVGLAFRPELEHDRISDIEGVFWIDRDTRALVRVDYRYTAVPESYRSARVGGMLGFSRGATGESTLTSWDIRMPLGVVQSRQKLEHSRSRAERFVFIDELKSVGGRVLGPAAAR